MNMKHYCLAFAFDDLGRVALIRKNRPDWQRGLWNGIGGGVDVDEMHSAAMVREFAEETGVTIAEDRWVRAGQIEGPDYIVSVWTFKGIEIRKVATITDEPIELHMTPPPNSIGNVPGMVALLRATSDVPKNFKLLY